VFSFNIGEHGESPNPRTHACRLGEPKLTDKFAGMTILGRVKYHLKPADLFSADERQIQRNRLRFGCDGEFNALSEAPG
jgi:hypothetical protein